MTHDQQRARELEQQLLELSYTVKVGSAFGGFQPPVGSGLNTAKAGESGTGQIQPGWEQGARDSCRGLALVEAGDVSGVGAGDDDKRGRGDGGWR